MARSITGERIASALRAGTTRRAPISIVGNHGGEGKAFDRPVSLAIRVASNNNTCERPRVAIIASTRGDPESLRTTTNSVVIPIAAATINPMGNPTQ